LVDWGWYYQNYEHQLEERVNGQDMAFDSDDRLSLPLVDYTQDTSMELAV
jgi:hypothetical protein